MTEITQVDPASAMSALSRIFFGYPMRARRSIVRPMDSVVLMPPGENERHNDNSGAVTVHMVEIHGVFERAPFKG